MPADPLGVRAACRRVVDEALEVRLGSLDAAAAALRDREVPTWDPKRHYAGEWLVEYVLVLDTLNFSFWGSGRGYWQLAEALRDAFAAGDPLWEPARLLELDEAGLTALIGEFPIPTAAWRPSTSWLSWPSARRAGHWPGWSRRAPPSSPSSCLATWSRFAMFQPTETSRCPS